MDPPELDFECTNEIGSIVLEHLDRLAMRAMDASIFCLPNSELWKFSRIQACAQREEMRLLLAPL